MYIYIILKLIFNLFQLPRSDNTFKCTVLIHFTLFSFCFLFQLTLKSIFVLLISITFEKYEICDVFHEMSEFQIKKKIIKMFYKKIRIKTIHT